jgi:polyhydroxybutyrate depolymerase
MSTNVGVLGHIAVAGQPERSYYIVRPDKAIHADPAPLVLVLHGGGRGLGDRIAQNSGFADVAVPDGAIVVFPNGLDGHWNDGRGQALGRRKVRYVDDVAFLSRLIEHLLATENVNPARVYMVGVSNGGMMAHTFACDAAEKVTAIATVIANMPEPVLVSCYPQQPVAVMMINGTQDKLIPYQGGAVRLLGMRAGTVASTQESIRFWARENGCAPVPEVSRHKALAPDDPDVMPRQENYQSCQMATRLWMLEGGGHSWPGAARAFPKILVGPHVKSFPATGMIWDFLKQQSRLAAPTP